MPSPVWDFLLGAIEQGMAIYSSSFIIEFKAVYGVEVNVTVTSDGDDDDDEEGTICRGHPADGFSGRPVPYADSPCLCCL